MSEREQLEQAIEALEAQRASLGDATVDAAVGRLRQTLAGLERAEVEGAPEPTPPAFAGERKLVTIVFADISGFTTLAERLDPEAVRDLVNLCFDRLVPIVEKYEGTVDKFIGDAIMVLFGAPVTHENDPERALRAALELVDALAASNDEHDTDLGIHVGVNTGLVIAGGMGSEGRQQYSVMGDAVNVAARLGEASGTGEILVGPDTHRLASALFEFEPLDAIRVQGKAEPVPVYRLEGLKAAPEAMRGIEGLRSPLVGRDAQLGQLGSALRRLQEGKGGVVAIAGEVGLGKSRLVAEARQTHREGFTWAEGRAASYAQGMSYWVARDVLYSLIGVEAEASLGEVSMALQSSVERTLPEGAAEVYPYLAYLLDLPLEEALAEEISRLTPLVLQRRMLGAFSDYVGARSLEQPLALVGEDLHWADPSSLKLLEALLPLTAEAALLVLLVFRPEGERILDFHHQMREVHGEGYQVLELTPLSWDASSRLAQNLVQIENMPAETWDLILDKAEGNPFFLEEVLRSLLDAGFVVLERDRAIATGAIRDIEVPDTLQGLIAARIDRLPPEDKQTLQTASVIGRVFQQRVLAHMAEHEQATYPLGRSLRALRRREFIRLRALASRYEAAEQEYIFKHVVTRDVTYHSLLVARRRELHKVAGEAIEALFPERLDELAATLGYHFEHAQVHAKAVTYLQQAGERAVRLSAYQEAIAHFTRALGLLEGLPDTPDRAQQELPLLLGLSQPLAAVKGYAASEVGRTYARARELSDQVGEMPHLFEALGMLGTFYTMRAEYHTALELAEQALSLAERSGDTQQVAISHWPRAYALLNLGEFTGARAHLEQTIALLAPQEASSFRLPLDVDPGARSLLWLTLALWFLGYPDQALKRGQEAIARARELEHPHTLVYVLAVAGTWHAMLRRQPQAVGQYLEPMIRLARGQGLLMYDAVGSFQRGWLQIEEGHVEGGIAQMSQGLSAWRSVGTESLGTYFRGVLAEGYGKARKPKEGLNVLSEALAVVEKTSERFYEAELHRLKGELLLMQGEAEAEPEACFREAIDVARRQEAKSLELRASVSLSRLLQKQAKHEEARGMLAEVYGWFTEGFGTPDLQEAKALLEGL